MALVVLIENPEALEALDGYAENDMRRWWGQRCKKHIRNGEVYFEVGAPVRWRTREGAKRFGSFGIRARVVRRPI